MFRLTKESVAQIRSIIRSCPKLKSLKVPQSRIFSYSNGPMRKIDQILQKLVNIIPYQNVMGLVVSTNIAVYLLSMFSQTDAFFYTPLLSQFAHANLLNLGINSFVGYMIGNHLQGMRGPVHIMKIVLLSVVCGGLLGQEAMQRGNRPFFGNDAIIRGLAYSIIFSNPYAEFMIFPLPIPIKAWIVGCLILGLDFYNQNAGGMGGTLAGFVMARV